MSEDRIVIHEEEVRSNSRINPPAAPAPAVTPSAPVQTVTPPAQTMRNDRVSEPRPRRPRRPAYETPAPEPEPVQIEEPVRIIEPEPEPVRHRRRPPQRRYDEASRGENRGNLRLAVCAVLTCIAVAVILALILPKIAGTPALGSSSDPTTAPTFNPAVIVAPTATAKPTAEVKAAPTPTPRTIYVTVQATPKIIYVTPEPTAAPSGIVRATGDVYIRTGPARGYEIIGVLKNGSRADYLDACRLDERGVAWYYIRHSGRTGWVSSRYSVLD